MNLVRGKQISTGLDGITAANIDTTTVPTLSANNTFTGANTFPGTLTVSGGGSISVPTPMSGLQAANKDYVDSVAQGITWKNSVRLLTDSNITLSGVQTIDGVLGAIGDRVLVTGQTTAADNGIYNMASGAWTRATDALTNAGSQPQLTAGMAAFVDEGTNYADSAWVLTTPNPITVGTTSLAFSQFSGAGQIIAGSGLSKTGNTLSVVVDNSSIDFAGNALEIKALGVATSHIAGSAVTTAKIAANAVTLGTMARQTAGFLIIGQGVGADLSALAVSGDATLTSAGVLTIAANAITTSKIANNAVTDAKLASSYIYADGTRAFTGAIDAGSNLIHNVTTPVVNGDAANKSYVDSAVSAGVIGGAGLVKTGSTLDVVNTDGSITVSADSIDVARDALGAVGLSGTGLKVNFDNSSIDINGSNQVEIKNSGVTAAKIAVSAVGNGLTGGAGTALAVLALNTSVVVSASGVRAAEPVTTNKQIAGIVTTADFDPATAIGGAIASTPGAGSWVEVRLNGVTVSVGNGVKTTACYFSGDGGTTARATSAIVAGDRLYWVGSVAGYQIDTQDTFDFQYNA